MTIAHGILLDKERSALSDQDIVVRAQANNKEFTAIIRRYELSLLRYIRIRGCRELRMSQNLLQEVFINAFIYLNDYDCSIPFSAWLYRIAYKETALFLGKNKPVSDTEKSEEEILFMQAIIDGLGLSFPQGGACDSSLLMGAYRELQADDRNLLLLKYLEGMQAIEIAHILQQREAETGRMIERAEHSFSDYFAKSGGVDHAG